MNTFPSGVRFDKRGTTIRVRTGVVSDMECSGQHRGRMLHEPFVTIAGKIIGLSREKRDEVITFLNDNRGQTIQFIFLGALYVGKISGRYAQTLGPFKHELSFSFSGKLSGANAVPATMWNDDTLWDDPTNWEE